jgi:hypothetical protein
MNTAAANAAKLQQAAGHSKTEQNQNQLVKRYRSSPGAVFIKWYPLK